MDVLDLKFYTICFLDSLALGLFLPILSSHITSLGGTHTTLGILATLYATVRIFSGALVSSWSDTIGKKGALLITLFINYIVYVPFGTSESYKEVIALRLVVGLTNHTQNVCNSFIAECKDNKNVNGISSIMNGLSVAGLVIGPIIGGSIYDQTDGFYYITRLAGTFLFICMVISLTLPNSKTTANDAAQTFLHRSFGDLKRKFDKLSSLQLTEQWDIVTLKYLHGVSAAVFFMKFSMLLKVHYKLPSSIIGCTYAYQGSLTFLAPFVVAYMDFSKSKIPYTTSSLFIAALGSMGLCFARTYDTYLISFMPMILAHTLLNIIWKDLFTDRSTKECNIEGAQDNVGEVASIVTPVVFGMFCDAYGVYALQAFVIVPILFGIFISIVKLSPRKQKKQPVRNKND